MTLNKEQIKAIIPQRDPILLVDEVLEMEAGKHIKAKFFASPDMDVFRGHFPGAPVLPGVLAVEAIAQTADILLLSFDKYAGKLPYFIGIEGVKFKKKISPGDTIIMDVTLTKDITEKAICICDGTIYNEQGEVATVAQVALAMR